MIVVDARARLTSDAIDKALGVGQIVHAGVLPLGTIERNMHDRRSDIGHSLRCPILKIQPFAVVFLLVKLANEHVNGGS